MKKRKVAIGATPPASYQPTHNLAEMALEAINRAQEARESLIRRIGSPGPSGATGRPADGLEVNENGPE